METSYNSILETG